MSFSRLQLYIRAFFPRIPIWHWALVVLHALVLTGFLVTRKRLPIYGTVALGVVLFIGLYLLDALALIRFGSNRVAHPNIDLAAEFQRIVSGNEENQMLMLFNTIVFVPFGFVLLVFLLSTGMGRRRGLERVALIAFGLSFCIECIQSLFRVGNFEVTDLVLNTMGGVIGGCLALFIFTILRFFAKTKEYGR